MYILVLKHFMVDILGLWWPGEKQSATPEERIVRRRFTWKAIFQFDKLCVEYQKKFAHGGKPSAIVIDVDTVKELCPDYARNNATKTRFSVCAYPPAKLVTRRMFRRAVENPAVERVVFIAGGTASGKTTVVKTWAENSRKYLIMDGTLSDYDVAYRQVWEALANRKMVLLIYVFAPLDIAMKQALDRAIERGRVVAINTFADTHFKAQKTVGKLIACHAREINFVARALNVVESTTDVPFNTIPKYENLDTVRRLSRECFERELLEREKAGRSVPPNIVQAFRNEGRRVGR